MKKSKICVYIPTASFFVGGGEVVPLNQAKFLSMAGHEITIVVLEVKKETSYFKNFSEKNPQIKIHRINKMRSLGDINSIKIDHEFGHKLYFSLGREIAEYLKKNLFDIILTHYGPAALFIPKSQKQILYLHGIPSHYQTINEVAAKSANTLVAVSNSVAQGWRKMFKIKKPIHVIQNGINPKEFCPIKEKQEDIDVFYVGRLIKIKGIQYLIKAIALLKESGSFKNLNVVIGGTGPYHKKIASLIQKLDLSRDVHLVGYVDDEKLNSYYNRSKLVVLPSYAKEGVLTTLLEAASASRAVITSNCCGMIDFIKDNENGQLFEPKNENDLKDKIEYLLKNKQERKKLGKAARKTILSNWTWEKSIARLLDLISDCMKK